MGNKKTATILPIIRVAIYLAKGKEERYFTLDSVNSKPELSTPFAKADVWLATYGLTRCDANIYLIDKVNGEWRTDWELEEGGQILPHPWATNKDSQTSGASSAA